MVIQVPLCHHLCTEGMFLLDFFFFFFFGTLNVYACEIVVLDSLQIIVSQPFLFSV